MRSYPWNGNVRELQNCVEKAVILCEGRTLRPEDLGLTPSRAPASTVSGGETLEAAEEKAIRAAMEKYSGNLSLVAKSLDISRPTLYNKLKKYGI